MAGNFRGIQFSRKAHLPRFRDLIFADGRFRLLHLQYPSGSTSYCTHAAAQIYLYFSSRDRESSVWSRLETFVQKKLNNNEIELVWSKPAEQRHAPWWPRPLLSRVRLGFLFCGFNFRGSSVNRENREIGSLENFRPYGILLILTMHSLSLSSQTLTPPSGRIQGWINLRLWVKLCTV